ALDGEILLIRRSAMENIVLVVEAGYSQPIFIEGIEVKRLLFAKLAQRKSGARRIVSLADRSALGEDLHDAIVRARAVEGRGRRTARHLDVPDVIGIEFGEPVLR